MIEEVTPNIIRIYFPNTHSCNAYYIKDKMILIDTGSLEIREDLKKSLPHLPEDIPYVFLTHLHYDHMGCFDLFVNSKIMASPAAIDSIKRNPAETIYDTETTLHYLEVKKRFEEFNEQELCALGFRIIKTPGHTDGSICLMYEDSESGKNILFSGDTIFNSDMSIVGRTDLPTSNSKKMQITLRQLENVNYDILCPGHGNISYND